MEKDCIFCKIIAGEVPAEFVYRGESVVAFRDVRPQAPVHILIVPVKHIRSINDLVEEDRPVVSEMLFIAKSLAREMKIEKSGYNLRFFVEKGGGQIVFHLHMHLMGGWK
jgi:histidine triad (HIT) family protein